MEILGYTLFQIIGGLAIFAPMAAIGWALGLRRGRPLAGFFLGLFLGPVGWLVALRWPVESPEAGAGG